MTAPITFGSDPEFLLENRHTGEVVPAVGLVGGTKEKPRIIGNYGLQEDNVMAEFTTPPCASLHENMEFAREGVRVVLSHLLSGSPACSLHPSCRVLFPEATLYRAGTQALQFGCSPDFDAYAFGERHPRVDPSVLGTLRFAGGHIHVGYKGTTDMPEHVAALMCDITLGLSLVRGGEQQNERRSLYGMVGRFRPTKYGVEYRTPSNAWLYDETLRDYLGTAGTILSALLSSPQTAQVRLYNEVPWNDVRATINAENRAEARALRRWLGNAYPDLGFQNVA